MDLNKYSNPGMTFTEANREMLKRHGRVVADIAYLFVDTLPVIIRRMPEGGRAIGAGSFGRLITRLNACAGELENWIFAPTWNDRERLPPLIETAGRTARSLQRWAATMDHQEAGFSEKEKVKVARACHALASDFEELAKQMGIYERSLHGPAKGSPLEETVLELTAYHDLLETLPPSSIEV